MMVAARLQELAEIEAAVWRELEAATHDAEHGWRVATLATWDGSRVDARCVVLREFDRESRTLLIYTDERSAKARQLEEHPSGTLVAWSKALGWQLRLAVQLHLQTAGLTVSSRWARLKMSPAAQDYLSPLPPGSKICKPTPEIGTRTFFATMTARVESIDWLELHDEGHRRALFDASGGHWLVP